MHKSPKTFPADLPLTPVLPWARPQFAVCPQWAERATAAASEPETSRTLSPAAGSWPVGRSLSAWETNTLEVRLSRDTRPFIWIILTSQLFSAWCKSSQSIHRIKRMLLCYSGGFSKVRVRVLLTFPKAWISTASLRVCFPVSQTTAACFTDCSRTTLVAHSQ